MDKQNTTIFHVFDWYSQPLTISHMECKTVCGMITSKYHVRDIDTALAIALDLTSYYGVICKRCEKTTYYNAGLLKRLNETSNLRA